MKTILVAVDGSEPALRAVRLAASMCKQSESTLELVTVLAPTYGHMLLAGTYGVPLDAETSAAIARAEDAWAAGVLRQAREAAGELGSSAQQQILRGSPAGRILERAKEADVWMLATGARGHGKVAAFLLGSVADRVVHGSPKPVLVVP